MSNLRKNNAAIIRSGKAGTRLKPLLLLINLLFLSSLFGLFSMPTNAAEHTNTASKNDSGYYDGSYGQGAYWVTPGLYGSMFSVDGNNVINSDGANSSTDKSLDSIREGAGKPKRYFIYSYYQLDQASDFIQISHDVARSENELMRHELRLPRKLQVKISRFMQSKNFIQA